MKKIILLIIFVQQYFAFDVPHNGCKTDLTIDKDRYHVSETYDTGDVEPTDATYDSHGNLFYVILGRDMNGYYFNIKLIKPNSTTPLSIPGLPERESYAVALDKKEGKVYFGTTKGIFEYNYPSEDASLVLKPDIRLNSLLVDKDSNKYITGTSDGTDQLYLLAGNKKTVFKGLEAVDEVAIDDKNNFYYIRQEKFFVLKSNLSHALLIGNITYEGLAQISFYEENVYIASETLSYIHENDTGPLKQVKNVPGNVSAVAFDESGNLVLGFKGKIIKYKPNDGECYQRS